MAFLIASRIFPLPSIPLIRFALNQPFAEAHNFSRVMPLAQAHRNDLAIFNDGFDTGAMFLLRIRHGLPRGGKTSRQGWCIRMAKIRLPGINALSDSARLEKAAAHENLCHVADALDSTRSEEHTSELQSLRHLVC